MTNGASPRTHQPKTQKKDMELNDITDFVSELVKALGLTPSVARHFARECQNDKDTLNYLAV